MYGSTGCHDLHLSVFIGVPLAADKIAGPATSLVFLGIELDSVRMEARLPDDKLPQLCQELRQWAARKCCRRKELEHLLGALNFACTVLPSGRCFMRQMFTLLHSSSDPKCFLRLNAEFRSDLAWWLAFASNWNGVSFMQLSGSTEPSVGFILMHLDLGDVVLFGAPVGFRAIGLVSGLTCQSW